MEIVAQREELRSSIRYYENKIDDLNDEIRELKKKLETAYEFKKKYEASCNQFFLNLENRRKSLNSLDEFSDRMKSARLYQDHIVNGKIKHTDFRQ